jgi:DNA-binding transcriptional LysR family regulator
VESGSLKDAAKRCFLTPSALSLQIKALEQELALKLFDHKGRKLELTPQGEIFYVEARKMINSVERQKKN